MRKTSVLVLLFFMAALASAQVLPPAEVRDDGLRAFQEKYFDQLKLLAEDVRAHHFPYPFYCSRVLDLDRTQQPAADQRSIRFEKYNHVIALEITGNYFASYSSELMDRNRRVRQTFVDVMLPLLKVAAPRFANEDTFEAFAFEISHHVRRKVLGVDSENPENVVLVLPREAARRLVAAITPEQQQAAILDGEVYLDGNPFSMWLNGDPPPGVNPPRYPKVPAHRERVELASLTPTTIAPAIEPTVNPKLLGIKEPPPRIVTAEMLGSLNVEYENTITRLVQELDSRAHFVSYAPPGFIAFRNGAYLQLSLTSPLDPSLSGSRYKLSALAFDEHVSQLVRAVLAYFPPQVSFDGIDFATSVHVAGAANSLSVEFIAPMRTLHCFAQYECTGQQLLDASVVLINGERTGLQLQSAEAEPVKQ